MIETPTIRVAYCSRQIIKGRLSVRERTGTVISFTDDKAFVRMDDNGKTSWYPRILLHRI